MARKLYKLRTTIRHNGARYRPGQERELLNILDPETVRAFISRGHLREVHPEGVALESSPQEESIPEELLIVLELLDAQRTPDENEPITVMRRLIRERDEALEVASARLATIERLDAELEGEKAESDSRAKDVSTSEPSRVNDPLVALKSLGLDIIGELVSAGYETPEKINAASDEQLDAVPNIGPGRIKEIRALLK